MSRAAPSAAGLAAAWTRLTARERWLIGVAIALAALLGGVWLGLLPGLDAARSAESRRARAADDLVVVRALADTVVVSRTQAVTQQDAAASAQRLADERGVRLAESSPAADLLQLRAEAPDSALALGWLADLAHETGLGLRAVTLSRDAGQGVAVSATLERIAP